MTALLIAGLTAMWGMFVMGWCAMWKIYVEVPMLLVLSNIVTGIVSCITTLLVGRTIAQLNQQSQVKNTPQIQQAENPLAGNGKESEPAESQS